MGNKIFERRTKEDKPVLAICYDFDKTLSPDDMQAQGYIQSVGYDIADFWRESNELAEDNDMDTNLAASLMGREQVRRLPVVENGKLCGMVTLGDLASTEDGSLNAADALQEITANICKKS